MLQKKEAALTVLSFLVSKEMQKKMVMNKYTYSGIQNLYDDEEVCSTINCDFFKSMQLVSRPKEKYYDDYSKQFRNYIYGYLYEDKPLPEMLQNIVNINKIYCVTIDTSDTVLGLIAFILIVSLTAVYIVSIIFLFMKKYEKKFRFFPKKIWILIIIGQIIIMNCNLLDFGIFELKKFRWKMTLYFIGFSFTFIPIVTRLIINFPQENKFSGWVTRNSYTFMTTFILSYWVIIFSFLYMPFRPIYVEGSDGKNFTYFKFEIMTYFWVGSVLTVKFGLITAILFFGFIEWNIVKTHYDIKFLLVTIYFDLISTVVIFLNLGLEIKDYKYQYFVQTYAYMSLSLINYIFIYGYRIAWVLLDFKKGDTPIEFYFNMLKSRDMKFQKSTVTGTSSAGKGKYRNTLLSLHFSKDVSNSYLSEYNSMYANTITTNNNESLTIPEEPS